MTVAVWDTYIRRKDGRRMHFDIIVPSTNKNIEEILGFGSAYLLEKGEAGQQLTTRECQFCHVEEVKLDWQTAINENGYYIYEMENCN